MGKKQSQTTAAAGIQIFELTMDNPEDQDELNRQLKRSAEANKSSPGKIARKMQNESTTESAEKKRGGRKNSSRTNG